MRKLGHVQQAVLDALKRHGSWRIHGCGWYWDTYSNTLRLLNSLVRAGYVTLNKGVYRPKFKVTP